ncbi:MAG: methyltransferase family protein [Syntrophothermus sp.]
MNSSTRDLIFRLRGIIPLPVLFVMILWSHPTRLSLLAGTFTVLAGELIRLWGAGYIKKYRVSSVQADRLVTAGPYAHVRNPLYWGNFFIGLGFSIMSNWFLSYVLFLAMYLYFYGIIIPLEEEFLERTFGTEFEKYKKAVPRVIPSFKRYVHAQGDFDWRVALAGEVNTILPLLVIGLLFVLKFYLK